jgi:capsular exopolysaccharide synthesis family protein
MVRTEQNGSRPAAPPHELSLDDLRQTLSRQRWVVLAVFASVVALAALATWLQRPVFESTASLQVDQQKDAGLSLVEKLNPLGGGGQGVIETDVFVLQSRQIAESVVDSLALTVVLAEPALPRDQVLRMVSVPRQAKDGTWELERQPSGAYAVRPKEDAPMAGTPAQVAVGAPFSLGGAVLQLAPQVARLRPAKVVVRVQPYRATVEALQKRLDVSRPTGPAQVVLVHYESTDPHLVAAVPNAVLDNFIRYRSGVTRTQSGSTVAFLREQVASYEGQLRGAEGRLRSFREQAQVVSPKDEATEQVHRLAELQARRDEVQSERDALVSLLARVEAASAAARPGDPSPYRQLVSFPVFLSNRAVQDLLQSITQQENTRAELLVRRTSANVDVEGIDTRIHDLEGQLFQIASSYRRSLDNELSSLNANLGRFGSQLEQIPAREVEFARLSRQQKLLEEIYTLLQTRLKEAEIKQAVDPGDLRVIDTAIVPEHPFSPRPVRNLALAVFLGLMLGAGAGFAREALDRRIRTPEQVETLTSGVPILGTIPRIRVAPALAAVGATGNGNGNGRRSGHALTSGTPALLESRLVTHRDPSGAVSEAYRALRTSLTFSSMDRALKALVFTSPMPGDGKSTSSSNLAITLAQQGSRTLLVDADLRRGLLHGIFGLQQSPGLTHLLMGSATLDEVLQEVPTPGASQPLYVIGSGVFPPNPSELLGSARMKKVVDELRERFDMVIFDAPPLNLVTDAAVLGRWADASILVTRAGTTHKAALKHAADQLSRLHVPVAGVVLNDFASTGSSYGYYGAGK